MFVGVRDFTCSQYPNIAYFLFAFGKKWLYSNEGNHSRFEVAVLQTFCSELLTHWVVLNLPPLNTLRPRQDGRHFADDIFRCIFFNENCCILIRFSLKYGRKGPIDNNPALVLLMAWRRSGDKPLSDPIMISLLTHICVTRPQWVKWSTPVETVVEISCKVVLQL